MNAYVLLTGALTLNALANILIKYAAMHPAAPRAGWPPLLQTYLHGPFLAGIACFALNVLVYTVALKKLPLTLAYPVMVSGGYLVILAVSHFLFQERLAASQFLGAGLIFGGLWLLVR